jgi:hypothetical protein
MVERRERIARKLHERAEVRAARRDTYSPWHPERFEDLSPGRKRDFYEDADAILAEDPSPGLVEALEKIVEVGVRAEVMRVGDMYSSSGYDEIETVSEEAQIAREALAALSKAESQ